MFRENRSAQRRSSRLPLGALAYSGCGFRLLGPLLRQVVGIETLATDCFAPEDNQYEDDFDRVTSVNAKGSFPRVKYEIAHMLKNGGGAG
jgi:hypothetical protein